MSMERLTVLKRPSLRFIATLPTLKRKEALKKYFQSEKGKEALKKYQSQLCFYNGETLTLCALKNRFQNAGIPHATIEAKKYLL